jgi:hypothetical protein
LQQLELSTREAGSAGRLPGLAEFLMTLHLHKASRLWVSALLLALCGCGSGRNQFAPACPVARLVPELADLIRYATPGGGHDVTDLVLQARISDVQGSCEPTDQKTTLAASVQISVSVLRGPAMHGREADVPVFLAVVQGETVRDKRVFPVHIVFPPNVDRLTTTSSPIDMALPVGQGVTGSAYRIISGFQLSPDELAVNRQAHGG